MANGSYSDRSISLAAEDRIEPRFRVDLAVLITGLDSQGSSFSLAAVATNISNHGALLSRVAGTLRSGDLVGIRFKEKKARFRVAWTRPVAGKSYSNVAVQRLPTEPCPWLEELAALAKSG